MVVNRREIGAAERSELTEHDLYGRAQTAAAIADRPRSENRKRRAMS